MLVRLSAWIKWLQLILLYNKSYLMNLIHCAFVFNKLLTASIVRDQTCDCKKKRLNNNKYNKQNIFTN